MSHDLKTAYLGDSVYVRTLKDGNLMVYLDNGYGPHNEIYMEPQVVLAFTQYVNEQILKAREEVEA